MQDTIGSNNWNDMTPTGGRITQAPFGIGCAAVVRRFALPVTGLALCFASLFATVIDDFEGGVKFQRSSEGVYYLETDLLDGKLVFSGQFPASQPDASFKDQNYNGMYWTTALATEGLEGRTLELRIDLVSASADNVFLYLGAHSSSGGYEIGIDQDELFLTKYLWSGRLTDVTSLFWVTAPVTNRNVTMVLAVTQMTDTVQLTTKVVDKGTGTILFEKQFVDGPGVDVPAPAVFPHGLTYLVADWGAPVVGPSFMAIAGVFQVHYGLTAPPPIEVVADNLEYDIYPVLAVSNSDQGLVFSWRISTTSFELESAPSFAPGAVWETVPTASIVDGDRQTVTLDATATARFFRLKQSP